MKKLLPVTADKVKVNILRRKEEAFIITVGIILLIIMEMLITILDIGHHSYVQGEWSGQGDLMWQDYSQG